MKLIRKLVLGCVTVGFLATTLAATTYAWYKLGNAAFAESFEFNASTTEGFLVSIDGVNYKHKLSTEDMVKAMLIKYAPNQYELYNGEILNKKTGKQMTIEEVYKAYSSSILLQPVTSVDGVSLLNLNRTQLTNSGGKYAEAELYLKCVSDEMISTVENGEEVLKPSQKYEIYLDGKDFDDGHVKASKTNVWSGKITPVKLDEGYHMRYLDSNLNIVEKVGTAAGDTSDSMVNVYTSNAFRFSVQDLGYEITEEVEIVDEDDPTIVKKETINTTTKAKENDAIIYEIADSEELKYNLGSYATKYNLGATQNFTILDKLYNADYNAMFIYYNDIRKKDRIDALLPETHPDTVTDLSENKIVTTVESGKVTHISLKFWIEGWDADCFDGLAGTFDEDTGEILNSNPVNVQLLFNSKKVD